jgi:membrane protein
MRAVVRLAQGLHYHDGFRAAPAMAFHFFLSLLPLLVFIGYVVGLVARKHGAQAVLSPIVENLPATTEAILKKEIVRLAGADTLGPLAAVGFLWIAAGGTHGLMDAVEQVVGAARRPWWKQRLLALVWVVLTLGAVGAGSYGVFEWEDVVQETERTKEVTTSATEAASEGVVPDLQKRRAVKLLRGRGERAVALGSSLVFSIVGLAAFYRFSVSHPRRVKRRVVPGAVLAVALWIAITWGFGLYARTLVDYAVFYGSLAAVAVLLLWLWLVSLAILLGAELNAQLEGLRDLRSRRD